MDSHTLDLLEFHKIRELTATYASCTLGKELARRMEPATDLARIRRDLALVTEMVAALEEGMSPPLAGLRDIRLLVRRAAIGSMLTAEQLLEVADVLTCTGHIYRWRMRLTDRFERLNQLLTPVEDFGLVARSITGCIDGRGHVLDIASPELAAVRRKLAELDERVQSQIRRLLRNPELRRILRFPNATVSGDHYVLPVAVNHRHKVQGVVHRTSASGETVYIEPTSIANLSAERAVLKAEEEREIRRVLRNLSKEVGRLARPLTAALEAMAELDFVTAKARYSRDYSMTPPKLVDEPRLMLRAARHPLLEFLFRKEQNEGPKRTVVPIDVRLGLGFNILVVTGPNTGGKTVALKTVGLLALMAQAGMHIPADEGSFLPVFHHVLADIGDEQSLEQSLSTFSSHMSRIATILKTADDHSLVLLDELGAGTDPVEGAALGRAILDELDRIGCLAIVTTHLSELKTYALTNPRAENGAVEFDAETLQPTYRLQIGQFGQSCALKIARRMQLPRRLLNRAYRYVRRRGGKSGELRRVQAVREAAEQARYEALQARQQAEQEREALAREKERLQRAEREAQALEQARRQLREGDPVSVPRFGKDGVVVRADPKRRIAVVAVGLGQWEIPFDDIVPKKAAE